MIFGMAGPISPHEFEYKVRRLITNYLIPPKNETKLKLGLEWMEKFRGQLPRLVHVTDPHWASKILEIESIIETSALSAHASLAREESRWGFWHYRTDYPERDDENWTRHIVLAKSSDPTVPEISFKEVETLSL
jgi:succinate dehydrogenase/fumarate reductase flavoprotein subunit